MRSFFILLKQEVKTLFVSPATYSAAFIFLLLMGGIYLLILGEFSQAPIEGLPQARFFSFFIVPVFFMVPLLTMRSIAEDRRLGTLETLMTTPVSTGAVIASKFFAAYIFYCLLWLITLSFPFIANTTLASPTLTPRLLDTTTMVGGFVFVAITGLLFIAIGIFSSSLTRSQLVAGMLCFGILFIVLVGPLAITSVPGNWMEGIREPLSAIQVTRFRDDFLQGVIDTRAIVFFLSNTLLLLGLSTLVVESKV